jgi:hypothetical protein
MYLTFLNRSYQIPSNYGKAYKVNYYPIGLLARVHGFFLFENVLDPAYC